MQFLEWLRPYYLRWIYFKLFPERIPTAWRDCWRYPSSDDPKVIRELVASSAPKTQRMDWIFLGMVDWHTRLQRPQQLALARAKDGDRVFYLNINLGRQYPEPPRLERRSKLAKLAENLFELHVALPSEPVFHHRLLTESEVRVLCKSLIGLLEIAQVSEPVIFLSLPSWNKLSHVIHNALGGKVVYDCHDWISGLSGMSSEICATERDAFADAGLVLFSSDSLLRFHLGQNASLSGRSFLLPNGVPEWVLTEQPVKYGPAVAFVGALEHWVDWPLVLKAAQCYTSVRFIIAGSGPSAPPASLVACSNVEIVGEILNSEVPALLEACTVAIIPFLAMDVTKFADPIKVYEYLYCGLPVVSIGVGLEARLQRLIYQAEDHADFLVKLGEALSEESPLRTAARKVAARQSTWSVRGKVLRNLVGSLSAAKANVPLN